LTQTGLYSAVLAKIGAERSKLLSTEKLNQLGESKNLLEFVSQLRDTSYAEKLAKLTTPLTSRKLERLFKEDLIETHVKIAQYSPKTVARFLRLHLLRFEVESIKTLVNATSANLSLEQKLSRIHLQVEDFFKHRIIIEEAAKATDLKLLVNALNKTDFAGALNFGLESYEESASIACLDVLVDKAYYEKLHDAFDGLPKKEKTHAFFYSSMENDGFTLLALLRGKSLKYKSDWLRLAVPRNNFELPTEIVEVIVTAPDFDSAFNVALKTKYSEFFAKERTAEETVAKAERAFRRAVFENAKNCRILELFNIGAPLAFMVQKEAEVHNLTALSLGVENGAKPEDTRNQLLT